MRICQNNEISSQNKGVEITEEKLIEIFESLIKQGANNINLVNPTHYALQIANVLKGGNHRCQLCIIQAGMKKLKH